MSAIDLRLNGPQSKVFSLIAPRQTIAIPWGRGVGKSWFLRHVAYLLAASWHGHKRTNALKPFRGIRMIALMPTLKQFRDVHGQLLEQEVTGEWSALKPRLNKTTMRVEFGD